MSSINPASFLHFIRPEVLPPPVNGVQPIPERDAAEVISDILLGFARMDPHDTYDLSMANDALHFELKSNDSLLQEYICYFIAWTVWLPCTLIGIAILQLSTSHDLLYRQLHIDAWLACHKVTLTDDEVIRSERYADLCHQQLQLFNEALHYDYLFPVLLDQVNRFSHPEFHASLLMFHFDRSRQANPEPHDQFRVILSRLSPDRLEIYLAETFRYNISPDLQSMLYDRCFSDGPESHERSIAGIKAILTGIDHQARHFKKPVSIPDSDKVFAHVSLEQAENGIRTPATGPSLIKWLKSNPGNMTEKLPEGHRLRDLVSRLTSDSILKMDIRASVK